MIAGAKVAHDMMLATGALTYFSMGDIANIAKGSVDVIGSGISNSFNKSDDTFRETGEGVGEIMGSAAMAAANFDMLRHSASIYGRRHMFSSRFEAPKVFSAKAVLNKGGLGGVFAEMEKGGGFTHVGNMVKDGFWGAKYKPVAGSFYPAESTMGKILGSKTAVDGYIREMKAGSKFVKGQGHIRGIAPFLIAGVFGHLAKSVLGFAGGIVDEAVRDYHRERSVHYDNRFFNTQRDEMSNYAQLGMAMNNYENRFQNTARIYHSR